MRAFDKFILSMLNLRGQGSERHRFPMVVSDLR